MGNGGVKSHVTIKIQMENLRDVSLVLLMAYCEHGKMIKEKQTSNKLEMEDDVINVFSDQDGGGFVSIYFSC
ncbi:hypothetical protein LIER_32531 [Lithospermum erythrorhizon]|uniref:Uncharacterized protein n=1 Tax=Lithospermum erythrorhizon TaxID=34254 RepID=A0AAV3RVW5_LITER